MSAYRPRILVIDDEPQMHRFLSPALTAAGFEVLRADNGMDGLKVVATSAPDAVILDLGLPDMDGKDVLTSARAFYAGPLIILSARAQEAEKIDCLDLGADDYVAKPFGVGEFLARLRVALRRKIQDAGVEPVVRSGELEVDIVRRLVKRNGEPVRLTPKEYELLIRLVEGGGKVLSHRQLLTSIWGPAHVDDLAYLRVLVGQLRQKIELDPASPRRIVTEPSVGYRFIA